MSMREWLIVRAGRFRLAVAAEYVSGLRRATVAESLPSLAALLGESSARDEDCALVIRHRAGESAVGVRGADLRAELEHVPLPAMLGGLAHPSITGLVRDQSDAVPVVDPALLIDL
jgi:hypothetical protein